MIDAMEMEELEPEDIDPNEGLFPRLPPNLDGVGLAVGSSHFVSNHRFADLHITREGQRTPRLRVSRYYWDLEPPVAVDFAKDIKFGALELATKKGFFQERDIRYLFVQDAYAGEQAEAILAEYAEPIEGEAPKITAGRVLVGPRRKRD